MQRISVRSPRLTLRPSACQPGKVLIGPGSNPQVALDHREKLIADRIVVKGAVGLHDQAGFVDRFN